MTADEDAAFRAEVDGNSSNGLTVKVDRDWAAGEPMDPLAASVEALPPIDGFPFLPTGGCSAIVVGGTGTGRSSLLQAGAYDGAKAGVRCAYLGSEVTRDEFNSRAAILANLRGDTVSDELRLQLAHVRYLDLADTVIRAWANPDEWIETMSGRYDVLIIDPISAVAAALDLDFDKANSDYVTFHSRLIQPLVARGRALAMADNIGHDPDAKARAKGVSAKSDRADLTFSCTISATPPGLIIKAGKIRSVRAGFQRGDEWLFTKDTQTITSRQRTEHSTFRPTGQMQRVSEAVEQDGGLSKRSIRIAVGGKAATVDLAIELLVSEGYIVPVDDGQARRHNSIKPYREPTVSDRVPPCPEPCPDTGLDDRVPVSLPLSRDTVTVQQQDTATESDRVPAVDAR